MAAPSVRHRTPSAAFACPPTFPRTLSPGRRIRLLVMDCPVFTGLIGILDQDLARRVRPFDFAQGKSSCGEGAEHLGGAAGLQTVQTAA